jgi:hypothetical protein
MPFMSRPALALVLALCVPGTTPPVVQSQAPAAAPVTIPFELATRHIIVKVRVNDSRPLSFVLDTGANVAIIRTPIAEELGLSLHGSVRTGGAGAGVQEGRRVSDARWSLVGLPRFSQPVSLALPLASLPSGLGQAIDGIIGGEFIGQFAIELDYQARTMTLHDAKRFSYSGKGEVLPVEIDSNGHPVLRASVTPPGGTAIEDRFVLDLGSGGALILHSPFAARHNLPPPEAKTVRVIGMAGAGGRSNGRMGRMASLQLGSFTLSNPITIFSQDEAGAFANPSLAGNIGALVASRFRTILDYSRRRIILEPSPTFSQPFDRAISGVALRAEGTDYRTFRVREVLEGSPATEAGIQQGDVITSVDGMAAASLTLTTLAEMLTLTEPRVLTLRRGDQTMKVTLTPKKLI